MRKIAMAAVFLMVALLAFGRGDRDEMSEEEALALLDQKIQALGLTLEDGQAAERAFRAIAESGARIRETYRIMEDGLDDGLKAMEMNEVAERVRARLMVGESPRSSENAAREMVEELVQARVRTRKAEGKAIQGRESKSSGTAGTPASPPSGAPSGGGRN